jgi:hypothetical protein
MLECIHGKQGRHPAQGDPGETNQIDINIKNMTSVSLLAVALLLSLCLGPQSCYAGMHFADSGPLTCDSKPPSLEIQLPAGNETLYGLDIFDVTWTINENHPAVDDSARKTALFVNELESISTAYNNSNGQHIWPMVVPDLSSGSCAIEISAFDAYGNLATVTSDIFTILLHDTGVDNEIPLHTRLMPARPNPFNPSTTLNFTLAAAGQTRLTVHDLRGRTVRTLIDHAMDPGSWSVTWDGRDDRGRVLPAAPYITRLTNTNQTPVTSKVVLLP